MKYKSIRLNALSLKLLAFLDKQKGFFQHGNNIRFAVHLGISESSLLYLLDKRPSVIIKEVIDEQLQCLNQCLIFENNSITLNPETILVELAAHNQFYTREKADEDNLAFIESKV